MKPKISSVTHLMVVFILFLSCSKSTSNYNEQNSEPVEVTPDLKPESEEEFKLDTTKLHAKAKQGLKYCRENNMNTDWMILADMGVHSGLERFIVWDCKGDSILKNGLVSHGCGDFWWGTDHSKTEPVFSNVPESHCSSLGKYKIGKRGWSNFGIHVKYELHGQEETNDNALKRIIVLHSWEVVPDSVLYPAGTPEGWGCPAVCDNYMRYLDKKLKKTDKPVLLWMYK